MSLLRRAEHAPERMDAPDVEGGRLRHALDDIAAVNRWLGGRRALLRHLPDALPPTPGSARILDVGTGSCDLPLAVARWAEGRGRAISLTGVDLHPGTIAVARERIADRPEIRLARADARRLPFPDGVFHLALLSMTLHHLDGPDLVAALRELGRVARGGVVLVGELERALPHYLGARLLSATLWRRHPVTRHDGPLSVLRAFTPDELLDLARSAGLGRPRVHRHPFYRLVLRAEA